MRLTRASLSSEGRGAQSNQMQIEFRVGSLAFKGRGRAEASRDGLGNKISEDGKYLFEGIAVDGDEHHVPSCAGRCPRRAVRAVAVRPDQHVLACSAQRRRHETQLFKWVVFVRLKIKCEF